MEKNATPPIQRPHWAWFVVLDGPLALLGLLVLSPRLAAKARKLLPMPSDALLRVTFFGAIAVHIGEGTLAWSMARKKGLPAGPWAAQTAVVGFPSLVALRAAEAQEQAI
jgi:hypothetical protein